jgi:ParB-like chromosome segregation protein Spo0J
MPKRTLLSLNISSLTLDPKNARKHGDTDIQAIAASLNRFGQQTPIVVTADNIVVKGNGTLLAAKSLGWTKIDALRTDLTGEELPAYSVADNRTGDLSEFDNEVLLELLQGFEDQSLVLDCGYDDAALAALIEEVTPDIPPEINEDEVPELPVEPVTKLGDLWLLGRHRLLCGDSTKADSWERL